MAFATEIGLAALAMASLTGCALGTPEESADYGRTDSDDTGGYDTGTHREEAALPPWATPIDEAASVVFTSDVPNVLGSGLAGGEDLTGDGAPDIVLLDIAFGLVGEGAERSTIHVFDPTVAPVQDASHALASIDYEYGVDLATDLLLADWDGDGGADLLSARSWWFDDPANAMLFAGPVAADGDLADAALTFTSAEHRTTRLASAGDFDADGHGDVWWISEAGAEAGLWTGPLATDKPELVRIEAESDDSLLFVRTIGADALVTFEAGAPAPRRAALLDGTLRGVTTPSDASATFAADHIEQWLYPADAGDLDGDGNHELLFGVSSADAQIATDRAVMFRGPHVGARTLADADATVIWPLPEFRPEFGGNVGNAGDVDGDGTPDLWISAPMGIKEGGGYGAGAVLLFSGASFVGDVAVEDALVVLTGRHYGDCVGRDVAPLGDIDGDGYADILVSSWSNAAWGARVYLVPGRPVW